MSKLPTRPEMATGERKPSPAPQPPAPKPAQPKPAKAKTPKAPSPWPWGLALRTLVSVLVVLHVAAVASAPWAIQTTEETPFPDLPPGRIPRDPQGQIIPLEKLSIEEYPPRRPRLAQAIHGFFWHYDNLLYINNGYDFFSPDPTFSHLIRYEVYDAQGGKIASGEFPNRREQWPRLLYHRYMMLVDQSSDPRHAEDGWENKIADRLLAKYDGARVKLTKRRHHLLTPQEVLAGRQLDNDEPGTSTYEVLGEMERRRDAPPALGQPEGIAIPGGAP
ncbi:MAG TPA: hypothetical protein VEQ85_13870 [Lacipirellulaceae bacterium]|nr:hypothetical protein [Lacipirellulaceae bacterium]